MVVSHKTQITPNLRPCLHKKKSHKGASLARLLSRAKSKLNLDMNILLNEGVMTATRSNLSAWFFVNHSILCPPCYMKIVACSVGLFYDLDLLLTNCVIIKHDY